MDHECDRKTAVAEPVQQGPKQCGLAGADITGEKQEPFAVLNAVKEFIPSGTRLPIENEVVKIGRRAERILAKSEKFKDRVGHGQAGREGEV